jgi:hypothetical protein
MNTAISLGCRLPVWWKFVDVSKERALYIGPTISTVFTGFLGMGMILTGCRSSSEINGHVAQSILGMTEEAHVRVRIQATV